MAHWLDDLAVEVAEARVSRRNVMLTGLRALAAGTFAGGGYRLFRPAAVAQAEQCGEVSQECRDVGEAAQQTAEASCAAELPANQAFCYAQAQNIGLAATALCARAEAAVTCGPCAVCRFPGGYCEPYCPADCTACDPTTHKCRDTCPPDQYCSVVGGTADQNGACVPKCPSPCAPYDPSTGGCRDTCNQSNPCMVCKQGYCQSDCPNKTDFCDSDGICKRCDFQECRQIDADGVCRGCDPNCETCVDGTCVSLCAQGEICCAGGCMECCGGTCDKAKGLCINGGPSCGPNSGCCPPATKCCFDAPRPGGGGFYNCCHEYENCCPPYYARCGC